MMLDKQRTVARLRVLVACEYSGTVRDAFRALGHDAVSCDLLPTERPGPHHQGNVLEILNNGWDMLIGHPMCTRLTNAGVRWLMSPPPGKTLVQMWRALFEGADFYKALRDANIPRKALENPVMHCHAAEIIRPGPRQIVQPWWFGDPVFKATGFELIGLPKLKATNRLTPPQPGTDEHKAWSIIHRASPGPNRAKIRSKFFPGLAAAMAEQWGGFVNE
jgi:hypothetical protein